MPAYASNRGGHVLPPKRAHIAVIVGQIAEAGTYPWMAYVLDLHGQDAGQCSGTVVAPNLVLTAGHCAENVQTRAPDEPSGYQVVTSNVNWAVPETERQVSGVTRVIPCPCFDRRTDIGDVALLQISTPTTAPAVTLASIPPAGAKALLAGWGKTYYKQVAPVERLRWAQTIVQRPQRCEREAPPFSPASELCVVDPPERRTGVCNGDSGGPLLLPEPSAVGGMVQIGVADHTYDECTTSSPSVFTRVDAISAWVKGWTQALASAPPASTPLPTDTVAAPTLPGVASVGSLAIKGNDISLALSCDSQGGLCSGTADATVTVHVRLIKTLDGRTTMSTHTHDLTLTRVAFTIASGANVVIHSSLSTQSHTLLSRLGTGPLDVTFAGQGLMPRVVRLTAR